LHGKAWHRKAQNKYILGTAWAKLQESLKERELHRTAVVTDGCAMFRHWVNVFNTIQGECLNHSVWAILDEAVSASKLGFPGLVTSPSSNASLSH